MLRRKRRGQGGHGECEWNDGQQQEDMTVTAANKHRRHDGSVRRFADVLEDWSVSISDRHELALPRMLPDLVRHKGSVIDANIRNIST